MVKKSSKKYYRKYHRKYTIEHNIPITSRPRSLFPKMTLEKDTLLKMDIGDSFICQGKCPMFRVRNAAKYLKYKICARSEVRKEHSFRVWLISKKKEIQNVQNKKSGIEVL